MDGDAPPARPSLDDVLGAALAERAAQGLIRRLRRVESRRGARVRLGQREVVNVASNDYLGLSTHPALAEAAARAARDWGAGSAASRLVSGSLAPHHELEERIAAWQQAPAALAFSSGFAAASGAIPALVGPGDFVFLDRLAHACCIDAAKASGATWRPFRHNDLDHLGHLLRHADSRHALRRPRILVVTEAVFSMDGDVAPLAGLVDLKDRHGAWLLLDEAHASGILGHRRAGLADHLGLAGRIDVHLGTLGKAVGASGGFIAGSRMLVDWLVNAARAFVFSTAPVPAASAAATEGIRVLLSPEGSDRATRLWQRIRELGPTLPRPVAEPSSAILPWILGDDARAMEASRALLDAGYLAPAIRYPTVPRRTARIRIALSSEHSSADVAGLSAALALVAGASPSA